MIDDAQLSKVAARLRGRVNRARGEAVECIVRLRLIAAGLAAVSRIEVGWKVQWTRGRVTGARPIAPVLADFTAIIPGSGRFVACEVKHRVGRLRLSDFEQHQVAGLNAVDAAGGLALVAWSTGIDINLLRWPFLIPGEALTADAIPDDIVWKGIRP